MSEYPKRVLAWHTTGAHALLWQFEGGRLTSDRLEHRSSDWRNDWTVDTRVELPQTPPMVEPPDKSVVLDRDGDAWQRHDRKWYLATTSESPGAEWAWVVRELGPLTLIHTGAES